MRQFAKWIGILSLIGTVLPPTMFMAHVISLEMVQAIMFVSCIGWFATAPFWMKVD